MKLQYWILTFFIISILFLMSCTEDNNLADSISDANSTTTTTTTTLPDGLIVTDLGSINDGGFTNSFTISSNTISFALYAYSDDDELSGIATLIDPFGQDVLSTLTAAGKVDIDFGFGSVMNPIIPTMERTAGTWFFQLYSNLGSEDFTLVRRKGTLPSKSKLVVQPYLTGTAYTANDLDFALSTFKTIFRSAGFKVQVKAVETISDSTFTNVAADYNNSVTSTLISQGAAGVINVFFVEDFSGSGATLLGIAAGIPGSFGIAGNRNGVMVGIEGHVVGGTLLDETLGQTAAHEVGHWIGLFHTTESDGTSFDPLSDTAQCSSDSDTNGDGLMAPSECTNLGGTNLMFWAADGVTTQQTLTDDQVHVIRYSPIAQ